MDTKEKTKINMAPPWIQYLNKLKALFEKDPNVKLDFDDERQELKIFVTGTDKAIALGELLPETKEFGGYTLYITVIPANLGTAKSDLILRALEGNKAFNYSRTVQGPMSNPMTFVVFQKKVVQYYIDDLGDLYGLRSTLYEDLANEVFEDHEGVFFCTDIEAEISG